MQQGSAMNSWQQPPGAQMPWSSNVGSGMGNMQQPMVRFRALLNSCGAVIVCE